MSVADDELAIAQALMLKPVRIREGDYRLRVTEVLQCLASEWAAFHRDV